MAYKEKGKVAIEISIIYHWSIGSFFYGYFMVTVLSSVDHAVIEAFDLEKKLLPSVRQFSFGESRLRDSIIAFNKLNHYRQDRIAGGPQG